jgi:hypothetical protein
LLFKFGHALLFPFPFFSHFPETSG